MPGQAVVTIKDKQWSVGVANTYAELTTGLSGMASIPAGTGMLFDMGSDQNHIQINMLKMQFPLDIIFINSTRGVVGVMRDVQPSETDVRFEANIIPGARYFLEVNAGEAEGIEIGDNVLIQGATTQPAQLDINSLMNFMVMLVVVVMMFKMVDRALSPPKEELRFLPQAKRELTAKWFEKGVEAGKTDGWMDVENTIKETAEKQPEIKDATELVWTDIDSWEETDHFGITYGSKMWEDAKGDIDVYSDLKSEFWEGYLTGRRNIGYDIYDIAGKLVEGESLPQTKARGGGKPTREGVSV